MKPYFGLFKMTFQYELQYRVKALSGIFTQLFWGFMYVFLYTAFLGGKLIDGFNINQMASYIWLGQAFFAMRFISLPSRSADEIVNGNVCYKFVRPINLYSMWYFEHLGQTLASTLLRFPFIIIIAFLLPSGMGLSLPASFISLLLFILCLIVGMAINNAISILMVCLTFKTMAPKSTVAIVNVISGVLGGIYIPLPLMPQFLQNITKFLPFSYISDLAQRVYIGNVSPSSSVLYLMIAAVWLIILILLGIFLLSRCTKKTVIQGG